MLGDRGRYVDPLLFSRLKFHSVDITPKPSPDDHATPPERVEQYKAILRHKGADLPCEFKVYQGQSLVASTCPLSSSAHGARECDTERSSPHQELLTASPLDRIWRSPLSNRPSRMRWIRRQAGAGGFCEWPFPSLVMLVACTLFFASVLWPICT